MTDISAALTATDEAAALQRVRVRLAQGAATAHLLDVAYRTADSPLGPLLVAATPTGVVTVAFEAQGHDAVLASLAARISPRVLRAASGLDDAVRQLDEYFAGTRRAFSIPMDLRLATGFRRHLLDGLTTVAYGDTVSYGELARRLGAPGAARAVGTGCARNPLPLLLPCHRVVRSDGTSGGYAGGAGAKRWLLGHEGAGDP